MKRGTIDHPKTARLARELGKVASGRAELGFMALGTDILHTVAVGVLERMWHFTARYAAQGDIGRWGDADIAGAVGWPAGEAAGLVGALVAAGWVDRSDSARLVVHDWAQHCDDAVHTSLARARLRFADGSAPKVAKLGSREREAAEAFYGNDDRGTVNDDREETAETPKTPEKDPSPEHAHDVRTTCAENRPALALALASGIHSLREAREAFKAMHPQCRACPDMAIDNTLRAWPKERWAEAMEAMGRHYAGDAPMRRPPLAVLENYLNRGPREKPADDGPVVKGRKWEMRKSEV